MASLFQLYPGLFQGRVTPSGWSQPEGSKAMVLGSDVAGLRGGLNHGDRIEVAQTATMTGLALLRFRARFRGQHDALPAGATWRLSWLVDAVEMGHRDLTRSRQVDSMDGALFVGGIVGNATMAFRLSYVHAAATGPEEVELPAFYVDAMTTELEGVGGTIANRVPEGGEVEVSRSSLLQFSVFDLGPSGAIDAASLRVFVNGVPAVEGAVFQVGFTGAESAVDVVSARHLRVTIDPLNLFDSEEVVTVRVVVNGTDPWALDETHTFTVVDETPPAVVSAQSYGPREVRVAFNEPMTALDPAGAGDALNPTSYVLDVVVGLEGTSIAALPAVVSVEVEASTVMRVQLEDDLSYGATYRVRVVNATDVHGNAVQPPLNRANFVAWAPPAVAGRRLRLWDFVPRRLQAVDARQGGDLRVTLVAMQDIVQILLRRIDEFSKLRDPNTAPEWAVDAQLADFGNPFPFPLSLTRRRLLLLNLLDIYALKGTDAGILALLRFFLGLDPVEVVLYNVQGGVPLGEAILDPLDPNGLDLGLNNQAALYSFYVRVARALSAEEQTRLRWLVDYIKPSHTHLLGILAPDAPTVIDHVELGLSLLGDDQFALH